MECSTIDFWPVQWFETLPSTNEYLRSMLADPAACPTGTVIAARSQTAGRGRRGARWQTSAGRDLAFSFVLWTRHSLIQVPSASMAVSLAVRQTLATYGVNAAVKWPNDVRVAGRKICGILAECYPSTASDELGLVVGVGMNVGMDAATLDDIDQPATSLFLETDRLFDPAQILERLLPSLSSWLDRWQQGGFASFRSDWAAAAEGLGQPVHVLTEHQRREGVLRGFGEHGELLLETSPGTVEALHSGEVRLRINSPEI